MNNHYNRKNSNRDKKMEHDAPYLNKMKRENPFTIPDNYFEDLQRNIFDQTINAAASKTIHTGKSRKLRQLYYVSAGIAAALLIVFIVFRMNGALENANLYLSDNNFIEYIEIDNSILIDELFTYNSGGNQEESNITLTSEVVNGDLSNEDLIEYLVDIDYEINILYNY